MGVRYGWGGWLFYLNIFLFLIAVMANLHNLLAHCHQNLTHAIDTTLILITIIVTREQSLIRWEPSREGCESSQIVDCHLTASGLSELVNDDVNAVGGHQKLWITHYNQDFKAVHTFPSWDLRVGFSHFPRCIRSKHIFLNYNHFDPFGITSPYFSNEFVSVFISELVKCLMLSERAHWRLYQLVFNYRSQGL